MSDDITFNMLVNVIKETRTLILDWSEYGDPALMDNCCEVLPTKRIPTYQVMNIDNGEGLYLAFNNDRVALSKKYVPGLKCAVCDICSHNDDHYYSCHANINGQQDERYLKTFVNIKEFKEKGR